MALTSLKLNLTFVFQLISNRNWLIQRIMQTLWLAQMPLHGKKLRLRKFKV